MQRRAAEASDHIRVASAENEPEADQVRSPVEFFVAGVKPRNVVPEIQRFGEDAEPPRIIARPVDSLEHHLHDFRIAPARSETKSFLGIGLAAGEHFADKLSLPVDCRSVCCNPAAM